MQVNVQTRYALKALVYLAQQNKYCSAKEISDIESIPYYYLEKILLKLKKGEIIKVRLGANGGYKLISNPKKITAYQVVKIFEETLAPVGCVAIEKSKKIFCPKSKNCATRKIWLTMQNNLSMTLKSMTIASLVNGQ